MKSSFNPPNEKNKFEQATNQTLRESGSLLTVKEVATYLNVKPATVRVLARDGKIQGAKINNRIWRFEAIDVLEYIKQRKDAASEKVLYSSTRD